MIVFLGFLYVRGEDGIWICVASSWLGGLYKVLGRYNAVFSLTLVGA